MALPGGRNPSIERVQTPTELSPFHSVHSLNQYILLARFVRFALCKGLRPLHPRTALARCPPSLAPLPGAQAGACGPARRADGGGALAPVLGTLSERGHWAIAGAKGKRNGGGSLKKQDSREARMVALASTHTSNAPQAY